MGKQLDYLKAYIRPFSTKIKKNYKLNEDSCKLFTDSIRVSPEYESILSPLQRGAFYSLNQACELPLPLTTICFPMNHISLHFRYFLIYHTTAIVNNDMKVKELRNFPRFFRETEKEGQQVSIGKPNYWGSCRIRHPGETPYALPSILMHSHGNPANNSKPTNGYSSYTSC
jgi:hypothetical protein